MYPQTHAAQRAAYYGDVEDLISPGFLSHSITVGKVKFALRTLGPGDLFILKHRCGTDLEGWQYWAVAASVWMVNGYSILDQPHMTPRIHEMLKALPKRAFQIVFSTFSGLLNRQNKAEEAIEAFMYESHSRTKWRSARGDYIRLLQGIPGAERLGMNSIQKIWTLFNDAEDRRIAFDNQWEGFKLVASSNSPKGVKKIDEKDAQNRRSEDERRQQVMDRYYYYRKGLVTRDGYSKDENREVIGNGMGPKSVEQLEEEMRKAIAGELDEHDMIVESYKQRILDKQAQMEAERAERRRRLDAEAEERMKAGFEVTPLVGYTQEQMQSIIAQRNPGRSAAGVRHFYDEEQVSAQRRMDRHVRPAAAGNLEVRDGRLVDTKGNPQQDMKTLQALVEERKVAYGNQPQQPQQPGMKRPDWISESDWDDYKNNLDPSVFGGQGRDD